MQNEREKFKDDFKKRLRSWVLRLIGFIEKLPPVEACRIIGKQLLRSGTSVLANYTEARAASSKKDFSNFFAYSLKSANESKMWLELLHDLGRGDQNELKWLLGELTEISNILASSILTMKRR